MVTTYHNLEYFPYGNNKVICQSITGKAIILIGRLNDWMDRQFSKNLQIAIR